MNAEEFLGLLAENSKEYDCYEYRMLLNIIRFCDTDTRNIFFPDTAEISGYGYGYSEVAVKLICYTIGTITDYGFNKAVVPLPYSAVADCLLQDRQRRWVYIFEKFIQEICRDNRDETFLNAVFEAASTKQFIIGTLLKMESESEQPVRLIFELIRNFCPDRFDEFFSKWLQIAGPEKVGQFQYTDYFSSYAKEDKLAFGIKDEVRRAITTQTNKKSDSYDVGVVVKKWLDSYLVKQYGLRSDEKIQTHYETGSGGCVSAGTMITLADGTQKEICRIQEWDAVLSEGGNISRTSDELVVNRRLDRFYGLNDMTPFLSFEHAVMTLDGWKSLDPFHSNEINPHFHVGLLKKGDVVRTLHGEMKVEQIPVRFAERGEKFTGYDLHFREGYPSYYANEILVLLNYPEITSKRVLRNLRGMSEEEQRKFAELAEENQTLLNRAFGMDIIHYLKEAVYDEL